MDMLQRTEGDQNLLSTFKMIFKIWKYGLLNPQYFYDSNEMRFQRRRSIPHLMLAIILFTSQFGFTFLKSYKNVWGATVLDSILARIYFSYLILHVYSKIFLIHQNSSIILNLLNHTIILQNRFYAFNFTMNFSKIYTLTICFIAFRCSLNFFLYFNHQVIALIDAQYKLTLRSLIIYFSSFIDLQFQLFYFCMKFILNHHYHTLNNHFGIIETVADLKN
ncbi:hypothetical protein HHI36_022012 [Cryptolaemus montrouzieri]|uniref:Transmembrane protein n=1 Tax=Cryptolaemus montrouzieri TaxID=559131 RepID=A0ABD2MZA1_9CUCU